MIDVIAASSWIYEVFVKNKLQVINDTILSKCRISVL